MWQVLRSNVLNASFWLLGVCMRACTGIVLRPIVFMLLLNEALPEARCRWRMLEIEIQIDIA